ncbi:unnamed protein product, partial [Rotaria magnacalcarata]
MRTVRLLLKHIKTPRNLFLLCQFRIMSSDPTIEDILQHVVTNQDESAEEVTHETYNIQRDCINNTIIRYDQDTDHSHNQYASYGTIGATSSFINNAPIRTNSMEETNRYLQR